MRGCDLQFICGWHNLPLPHIAPEFWGLDPFCTSCPAGAWDRALLGPTYFPRKWRRHMDLKRVMRPACCTPRVLCSGVLCGWDHHLEGELRQQPRAGWAWGQGGWPVTKASPRACIGCGLTVGVHRIQGGWWKGSLLAWPCLWGLGLSPLFMGWCITEQGCGFWSDTLACHLSFIVFLFSRAYLCLDAVGSSLLPGWPIWRWMGT